MATNLFKGLKPNPQRGKSGFDLSQKHVFSTKPGELRPVMAVETVPDDYFELDAVGLSRTMTMNRPAFVRGKMHYDVFFVPYSQLWHPFNQFITQRIDKHTANQKGSSFVPVFSLGTLFRALVSQGRSATRYDIFGKSWLYGAGILLDMLGYGAYQNPLRACIDNVYDVNEFIEQYELDSKYCNVFRLAAYQHIWYDFYRNKYFDTESSDDTSTTQFSNYINAFNFDDIDCSSFANSIVSNSARLTLLTTLRYRQWKKDIFTSAMPSTQFGAVSSVSLGSISDLTDKLNHYHDVPIDDNTSIDSAWTFQSGGVFDTADTDVVMRSVNSARTQGRPYTGRGEGLAPDVLNHTHSFIGNVETDDTTWDSGSGSLSLSSFDVLNLRRAEVLQNWRQAALRAGNMTDDSMRAHYGVEPYYNADENVHYLGSFTASLDVDPVTATAATTSQAENGRVGDMAANGKIALQGKKIKFKCRDFGVIMVINSFVPDAEYNAVMVDKSNTLYEPFDFFTPEFENVGLEPLTLSEYNILHSWQQAPQLQNSILGYVPRYHQYKTAVDKVHGEFIGYVNGQLSGDYGHSLAAWVAPRVERFLGLSGRINYTRALNSFYINPDVFNMVMAIAANDNENTDVFINNVFFDIKAIRPMTVLGLPQF